MPPAYFMHIQTLKNSRIVKLLKTSCVVKLLKASCIVKLLKTSCVVKLLKASCIFKIIEDFMHSQIIEDSCIVKLLKTSCIVKLLKTFYSHKNAWLGFHPYISLSSTCLELLQIQLRLENQDKIKWRGRCCMLPLDKLTLWLFHTGNLWRYTTSLHAWAICLMLLTFAWHGSVQMALVLSLWLVLNIESLQ